MSHTRIILIVPPQHGPPHGLFSMETKEGIPCLLSQTPGEEIENSFLAWQNCVCESWEMQVQVILCPTCSLSASSRAAIPSTPGNNPMLSAGILTFPRSNLEFVTTAAHRLTQAGTPLTKKSLMAFFRDVLWEIPTCHYRAPHNTSPAQHWSGVNPSSDIAVK